MAEATGKLAIVGASVRAAAFSAMRAGYEVVAADLFADADLRRVCQASRIDDYPAGLAHWLAATPCDGWLYTGALETHPDLVEQMAQTRPLLGVSGDSLRRVRDPLKLQQVLSDRGLSFPETLASPARLPLDGDWLCKTYRGASGSGVWRLSEPGALERAAREGACCQRFVHGLSAAAIFVCSPNRTILLGVTQQLVGEGDGSLKPWRYVGSIGPLTLSAPLRRQLERLGEVLSSDFALRGLVGVDLVIADDRAVVIEVNPRYSASVEIVERFQPRAAIAEHVRACARLDQPHAGAADLSYTAADPQSPSYGKLVLYARSDAVISRQFFAWAMDHALHAPRQYSLADITDVGAVIGAGQPVLTIFATGPRENLIDQLRAVAAEVESRLYATGG